MIHNLSKTRLYSIYSGMKQRCYNPDNSHYKWYGAKGISICDEWMNDNGLQNFIEWALLNGYNENLTIDRIDSNKNYSPKNCQRIKSDLNSSKLPFNKDNKKHNKLVINNPAHNIIICSSVSEQIKILCVKLNISVSELARLNGSSPQAFNQKMKREGFTPAELIKLAETAGCKYEGSFILPNGDTVTD